MKRFCFFFLFLISATLLHCNTAFAMLQENLSSGDQTAQTFLNQMNQKKGQAGAHPFYQGVSKEARYKDTELKGRGQTAAAQDPGSQMVMTSSDKRPQMKIDPLKDPLLTGSQKVMDNPLEVIGGKGTQVVEVQQAGKTETLTCEESGENSLETCTRELTVKVTKTKVQRERVTQIRISGCKKSYKDWHVKSCPALLQQMRRWRRPKIWKKNLGAIDITGAFKACLIEVTDNIPNRCAACYNPRNTLSTDLKNDQILRVLILRESTGNPQITGTMRVCSHGHLKGYDLYATLKIIYEEDSYRVGPDEWSDNCARLEERVDSGLCNYSKIACTQGPATRVINGVPVKKDCWQETRTYACSFPAKDDCGPLRARGCAQINSVCKQRVGNACVVYQQTYQCKDSSRTTFQIAGGDTSTLKVPFCMDGNCRDQLYENNDELMSSVAQLSILKEMQGNFKKGFLFSGKCHQCSKYFLSFKDCCGSGKGWGKDIGLGGCKGSEKLLNKKRKEGLCHRVGTYCAKKALGKCVKKKTSFCCFGSKLLKAFQEQGRAQIGLGWGSAEQPLCRGFTIAEVQRIDFSKLDLREVFEELMKNYKPGKIQGQNKKLQNDMNFPKLHNQGAFDVARKKYAPPPEGQNMGQKVGERLEIIKRGLATTGSK